MCLEFLLIIVTHTNIYIPHARLYIMNEEYVSIISLAAFIPIEINIFKDLLVKYILSVRTSFYLVVYTANSLLYKRSSSSKQTV